jgi:DNA-binding NarL/FixJ family response regulator
MIAEKLDITKSAITNQLHFLYRRMGVPNNIAAVVEGIRRGIVKIGE